ncbi:hypothetical protein EON65_05515 [archaeon]|nr:MAG: hypothetical protein EON65_05515 [archaeon]
MQFGQGYTHDLIPNGRNIPVTEENKQVYVKAIAHYRMTHSISAQIEAFKEGRLRD